MRRGNDAKGAGLEAGRASSPGTSSKARLGFVLASLCLLLVGAASSALADEAGQSFESHPSAQAIEQAIENPGIPEVEGPHTNPLAAEELPHRDLDRDEALELLRSVFGPALEAPAGIFDELEVEKFYSDHVALVAGDQTQVGGATSEEPALLESVLPLKAEGSTGDQEAVDLGLEHAEGELQSTNPLVEVGIPSQIDEGISLPESGVEIDLAGAPEGRGPSIVAQSTAFYPNIALDTDLTVAPTPKGVETMTQLRSADAPRSETFNLSLPSDASLKQTEEGGAEVSQAGRPLIVIPPPSALDANGEAVPVSLEVDGDSLIITTSPSAESAYPILVDPIYEYYDWRHGTPWTTIWGEWSKATNSPEFHAAESGTCPGCPIGGVTGLQLTSGVGTVAPGSWALWYHEVPRMGKDKNAAGEVLVPTSYIQRANFKSLYFDATSGLLKPITAEPYLAMYLWDPYHGFAAIGHRYGTEGDLSDMNWQYELVNYDLVTDVKQVTFQLVSNSTPQSQYRQLYVGEGWIELNDKDYPGWGSVGSPSGWVNNSPTSPISFSVTDPGLGMYGLQVRAPALDGTTKMVETQYKGCAGSVAKPCPRTWSSAAGPAMNYDPSVLPQGENWAALTAGDPLGHLSTQAPGALPSEVKIKVDHTAPSLTLSGSATEQAKLGTMASQYALKYNATDGADETAAALVPFGTTGTSEEKVQRPLGITSDRNGHVWIADRENNRVVEFDEGGKFLMAFGTKGSGNGQLLGPSGIAVTPSGNLWVADTGNDRLQQFNAKGEYLQQFGTSGNGGGTQFAEPYGVAASNGFLWVSDLSGDRVAEFREDPASGRYVRMAYGSAFNSNGLDELDGPAGLATDPQGNVWVVDCEHNRVQKFDSNGKFIMQFGSPGTGNGQFKAPTSIAIAPSGNVLVMDSGNNRAEEFQPSGTYLRQFGSVGSSNSQFSEPRGVAIGAGNAAFIADASNHRVARWSNVDRDPQSGVFSTEVTLDGNLVEPKYSPGCAIKNCAISREWLLKADNYSVGLHKLEVTATDGVGLSTTKYLMIETHGDLVAPSISLSGAMTEQATLGTTRPAYLLKVNATDPGSAQERQSGVAATTIKVDGSVVDTTSPGCSAGGCSISREWTLNSNSYLAGTHIVQVTATDGAGRIATKTLAIEIKRDTTAPQITATNNLFTAPEGWVEQISYAYSPTASDLKGYGVTALTLKIDGAVVKSATQSCANGACGLSLSGTVAMTAYDGGAHPAELIATDGAGNVAKKSWTINVDPKGSITVAEAEDTLEAAEETSPINLVGSSQSEDEYEGTVEGLELQSSGDALEAIGSAAPTTIQAAPGGGLTVEVPPPSSLEPCTEKTPESPEGGEGKVCDPVGEPPEPGLLPIEITPVNVAGDATETLLAGEEAAAVSANLVPHVDLIARPLYDGAMTFAAIRDATAPETYSWLVDLEADQELKLLDSQHAEVYTEEVHPAFGISATPAHDAIGRAVSTSLSVSGGNVVTLTVKHHENGSDGKPFVYPVIAGAGWEGGFQTYEVVMPPPEPLPGEEEANEEGETEVEELEPGVGRLTTARIGPPEGPTPSEVAMASGTWNEPNPGGVPLRSRKYVFNECHWKGGISLPSPKYLARISQQCHGEISWHDGVYTVEWAIAAHGRFSYRYGHKVGIEKDPKCNKWGPEQPAQVDCLADAKVSNWKIHIFDRTKFPPGGFMKMYLLGQAICVELEGVLPIRPQPSINGESVYFENKHLRKDGVLPGNPCPWGQLRF